jgi:hypothetical protein
MEIECDFTKATIRDQQGCLKPVISELTTCHFGQEGQRLIKVSRIHKRIENLPSKWLEVEIAW